MSCDFCVFCLGLCLLLLLLPGHSTATGGREKYRPSYLDHFEKKEQNDKALASSKTQPTSLPSSSPQPTETTRQQKPGNKPLQQQLPAKQVTPPHHFQRSFIDGDFEFVSVLGDRCAPAIHPAVVTVVCCLGWEVLCYRRTAMVAL